MFRVLFRVPIVRDCSRWIAVLQQLLGTSAAQMTRLSACALAQHLACSALLRLRANALAEGVQSLDNRARGVWRV